MPGYVLTHFLVYAIVNAFTPGPGNILALNTVTNYGWKKGKPLFLGIFTGYYHRHEGNLKAAGVEAEVDVYPTNMHAFDMLRDDDLSREAIRKFEQHFEKALRDCRQEGCP